MALVSVSPYCFSIVCDRPNSVFPSVLPRLSSRTPKQVNCQTCIVSTNSKSGFSLRNFHYVSNNYVSNNYIWHHTTEGMAEHITYP